MIYAVIDTNVLVSALLSKHDNAATVQIIESIFNGIITPVYSDQIIYEYRTVLQREKFKFPQEAQNHLIYAIEKFGIYTFPPKSQINLPDVKDLPFYEAAIAQTYYYLITGNKKHFPDESFVLTPRAMINILNTH